ncbi:MAG: NAD(P)H-dependent oxidoreductase subunit E [Gammaproteobacteria bacterium]|nr:NAD(P)H-dependent oxidoreductase subunit E [Gammaproteobacteria bacterium]
MPESADNKNTLKAEITALADQYGYDRSALMPILQAIQSKYHHVPYAAIAILADTLKDVYASQIQGVVTFYHLLNTEPKGEFIIRVSHCAPCKMKGAQDLMQALEKALKIQAGQTTQDGKFTLEWTSCIGMCDHAPAMLVNEKPIVDVDPEKISEILKKLTSSSPDFIHPANQNKLTFSTIKEGQALQKASQKSSHEIIEEITASKLRGCGGAGFPTGLKLKFAAGAQGDPKYVVCNADEGEPGTFKDREILTRYPYLVFEGMNIAAKAIGASQGILYLRGEYTYLKNELAAFLEKARDPNFKIEIRMGSGAYVCGEETALIESLEGKRGEPRNRPPFPIQSGYLGKPTLVNNVETYAWMATILVKGAAWFNAVGTEKSKGYKLFSISGDCKKPGIYEFPMGTTIKEMLETVGGEDAQAIQAGGASGNCISQSGFSRKFEFDDAPPSGSIMIFGPNRSMLDIAENFMEFFVEESCGQCTPCREGNVKLLKGIRLLKEGKCSKAHLEDLKDLCETMQLASKCGLGQMSSRAFLDIIDQFQMGA